MNDRRFDLIEVQNSAYRPVPKLQGFTVFDRQERGDDRWLIAKASLLAHTFQITSRNLFVAAQPPSIERSRRKLHESWKRLCTVAVFLQEVSTGGRKTRNLAGVPPIRCLAVERMMNHTLLVQTGQGMIEARQD